jgi:accessory gene regulator B
MLNGLSIHVVNSLCESGLINQEDKEIYLFGIETALLKIIHYSTMLIIGIFFGMIPQTITFIIAYTVLRQYAGGYHANTRMRCYIISWFMMISSLLFIKLCPIQAMLWISLLSIISSCILIFLMVPVENKNKPLDTAERNRYGAMARIIAAAEVIISFIFMFINLQLTLSIALSLLFTSVMLILGKIKYSKELIT